MKRLVRCIDCLLYDDVASGRCVLSDKEIKYPYANRECFFYANKEKKNDVQRDHNEGT